MAERKETYIGNSKLKDSPENPIKIVIGENAVKSKHIADSAVTKGKLGNRSVEVKNLDDDVQNLIASMEKGGVALSGEFGDSELIGINQKKLTEVIGPEGTITQKVASLEETVGEGGSIDERIATAKSELIDGASEEGDTFKKIEDRLSDVEESVGEGGSVDERIAVETNRAQAAEELLREAYESLSQSQAIPKTAEEWAAMTSWEEGVIYRVAGTTSYTDYMYNGTTTIPMATYNNAIDNEPTAGSDNLVKSGGVQDELALGAVYDVSAKNPTAGADNDGKFTLEYILSNANTLIPVSVRKGGMSIKFVQSSDNKYMQYRLMSATFSNSKDNWQGVDDEPSLYGNDLILSKAVFPINAGMNPQELQLEYNAGFIDSNGIVRSSSDYIYSQPVLIKAGTLVNFAVRIISGISHVSKYFNNTYQPLVADNSIPTGENNYSCSQYYIKEDSELVFCYKNTGTALLYTKIFTLNLSRNQQQINNVEDKITFDISDYNKNGAELAVYDSLSDAISAIPDAYKVGGVNIKYIESFAAIYDVEYFETSDSTKLPSSYIEIEQKFDLESGHYNIQQIGEAYNGADKDSVIGDTGIGGITVNSSLVYCNVTETNDGTMYYLWKFTKSSDNINRYVQYSLIKESWTNEIIYWKKYNLPFIEYSSTPVTNGGYIGNQGNQAVNFNVGGCTRPYFVKKGDVVCYYGNPGSPMAAIAEYDAGTNRYSVIEVGYGTKVFRYYYYTAQKDEYLVFSGYTSGADKHLSGLITVYTIDTNDILGKYLSLILKELNTFSNLPAIVTDINNRLNTAEQKTINNEELVYSPNLFLAFDNIVSVGDSLTDCQVWTAPESVIPHSRQAYNPWTKIIKKLCGLDTYSIYARSGATSKGIWEMFKDDFAVPQTGTTICTIFLGTNNWFEDTLETSAPADKVDTYREDWADDFTGSMCKIIQTFINFGCKILIIRPHTGGTGSGGDDTHRPPEGWTVEDTNRVLLKIIERFNCAYIDNASTRSRDFAYHAYPDLSGFNNLHYNDLGYARFATRLIQEVGRMPDEYKQRLIPE